MDIQTTIDAAKQQGMHVYGTSDGGVYASPKDLGENPDDAHVKSQAIDITKSDPNHIYKSGEDYYSPDAVAARQSQYKDQVQVLPTMENLNQAVPGEGTIGEKVTKYAPALGAGVATALLPEGTPWYWMGAAGAGGAGAGKYAQNKINSNPNSLEGVPTEAVTGAIGGSLAKPLGAAAKGIGEYIAPKIASKVPALAELLYGASSPEAIQIAKGAVPAAAKTLRTVGADIVDTLENMSIKQGGSVPQKLLSAAKSIENMTPEQFAKANFTRMAGDVTGDPLTYEFKTAINSLQNQVKNAMSGDNLSSKLFNEPTLRGAATSITDLMSSTLAPQAKQEANQVYKDVTKR